jgi:small-conductance mechanosensitive channel
MTGSLDGVLAMASEWLVPLCLFAAVTVVVEAIRRVAVRRIVAWAKGTDTVLDDALGTVLGAIRPWFAPVAGAFVASNVLPAGLPGASLVTTGLALLMVIQAGLCGHAALGCLLDGLLRQSVPQQPGLAASSAALRFVAQLLFWSAVALVTLATLGVDITAVVAGLGVGGIAVALAVQNILGDLFASLAIALDKPFIVGDFIVVGDFAGSVERVGLKTTQVRSISGEQIVLPNSDLLGSRLRNFKRMRERRIVMQFGVTYETPVPVLADLPGIVRAIITDVPGTRFDRAHLQGFGASSLDFEVVYHVLDPDYGASMDCQQAVMLRLLEECARRGVDFAYPTRTVHIARPEPGQRTA